MTSQLHRIESLPSLDGLEVPGERFVEAGATAVLTILFVCIFGGLAAGWFVRINATQVVNGMASFADAHTVTITASVRTSMLANTIPGDTARVAFASDGGAVGPWIPALITDIAGPCRETGRGPVDRAPNDTEHVAECRMAAVLIGDSTAVVRSPVSPIPVHVELRIKRDRAIRVLAGRVLNRLPAQR
jgi:hypothetical protein